MQKYDTLTIISEMTMSFAPNFVFLVLLCFFFCKVPSELYKCHKTQRLKLLLFASPLPKSLPPSSLLVKSLPVIQRLFQLPLLCKCSDLFIEFWAYLFSVLVLMYDLNIFFVAFHCLPSLVIIGSCLIVNLMETCSQALCLPSCVTPGKFLILLLPLGPIPSLSDGYQNNSILLIDLLSGVNELINFRCLLESLDNSKKSWVLTIMTF